MVLQAVAVKPAIFPIPVDRKPLIGIFGRHLVPQAS
jgi:hypothetical protein